MTFYKSFGIATVGLLLLVLLAGCTNNQLQAGESPNETDGPRGPQTGDANPNDEPSDGSAPPIEPIGPAPGDEPAPQPPGITGKSVNYHGTANGYLARPDDAERHPGIILIHEWWGLNENMKLTADKLANEGYIVLAVDLYNGKSAANADEARVLVSAVRPDEAVANLKGAKAFLKETENATKVGSFGYCFGGGQSMQLAVSGEPLDATVIYYGSLVTEPALLEKIKWPILGVFGELDTSIPVSRVNEFEEALADAGVEREIHVYPAVGHAFANPSNPGHAVGPTADAWAKTLAFLARNLKDKA